MTKNPKNSNGSNSKPMGRLLISAAQGAELTGVCESTWWEWQRAFSDFPNPLSGLADLGATRGECLKRALVDQIAAGWRMSGPRTRDMNLPKSNVLV